MKRKRNEKNEKNKKNAVYKNYESSLNKSPPNKVIFHSIKDRLPPDTGENILYFDPLFGYAINKSAIILQHIHEDIRQYQFSRTTHWARLKIKNKT
jgi:hypothetical protein